MIEVFTDDDVRRLLPPDLAIEWMREALVAEHRGRLHSPPRVHTDLGDGRLVFTTGALEGKWFGYRSYDSFEVESGEQVVVVHGAVDGRVRGIAVGNELGPRRVGAIGGVAADILARTNSRDADRRHAFAARARSELRIAAHDAPDARTAVDGADIVVLATNSPTPVIDPRWLAPGSYVTTLGPKQVGRAEFGPELVAVSDLVFTDSLAQISAYDPPNILVGTPQEHRLAALGAVLAGDAFGRISEEQLVLFCSVGLAGTEVFLLDRLLG